MKKIDLVVIAAVMAIVCIGIAFLAITFIACDNAGSLCENRSMGYCEEGK